MRYKQSLRNLKREIDLSILSYVFQCALTCVVLIMNYTRFLNDVNAIRVVIDHCPWSIRVYRYMDVVTGNLFCFVQIACGSKNVFTLWNYFGGSKWKLRRNLAGAIYKDEEMEKRGQQEFRLNCKKSSKQSSIQVVCHRLRETQSLRLFCFEQVSALKKISKKQYTSKIQRKRRTRQKVPFGTQKMPKLAQIPEHEKSSIMFMSSGDTFACGSCATPHFDVICDQLLNRRTATWNL